jgi:hypothetical protein
MMHEAISARSSSDGSCCGRRTAKTTTLSPFISSGTPMAAASLTEGWLTAADSTSAGPRRLPATFMVSSERPRNVPVAIFVYSGPIAMHPGIGDAREVGVYVAGGVAPEAAGHSGPGASKGKLTHRAANRVALVVQHVGCHAGERGR